MSGLDYNHRAAIAADLDDLKQDKDTPVYIEGDVWMGRDFEDMEAGEASRIAVNTVLDHPFVKQMLDERELYWEALKWCASVDGTPSRPPEHLHAVIEVAMEAAALEGL